MIDFTLLPRKKKAYAGANGTKICVVYEGQLYMLKFPPTPSRNKEMSYTNGCISEYLGCHIYKIIGIPVQDTLLGTFQNNGKEKIVVACRDFTSYGIVLQDFASLKNQVIDSVRNGYGTELEDILFAFSNQSSVDEGEVRRRFWDMFIVDALIGNWDRHNGNWGFLYNQINDSMVLAPVFDCGSSLYPQADDEIMSKTLLDTNQLNYRVYEIPTSAITLNNRRINYFKFISSLEYEECNQALERIVPRIDIKKINQMIDCTPYITNLQKDFYKTMIQARKEKILDYSLKLYLKRKIPQEDLEISSSRRR